MTVVRILREEGVAQTRWAALDRDGQAIGLYIEPADGQMMIGQRVEGRIRAFAPGAGGAFIEIPGHGDAFLRLPENRTGWTEGSTLVAEIVAEPRDGKLARVRPADLSKPAGPCGAQAWRRGLIGGEVAPVRDVAPGDAILEGAVMEALSPYATLAGGGRLGIDRTRALTAGDIDTAGRDRRGTAANQALSVNSGAAALFAREIVLRGIGGLCVLDCIAPLNPKSAARVREAFLNAWTKLTSRPAKVLTPSVLGLMELSVDWWIMPVHDHFYDTQGERKASAVALDGLRQVEKVATDRKIGRFSLAIPRNAHDWLVRNHPGLNGSLAAKYGARLEIVTHDKAHPEVSAAP